MAKRLLLTAAQPARLISNPAQQAIAHLSHDSVRAALLALMPAGTEVDAGAVDQAVGIAGDVRVNPLQVIGQAGDVVQARVIGLGNGISQQLFNFIADREGRFQ